MVGAEVPGGMKRGTVSQGQAQEASVNKFYRSNKKYWLSTELIDWTSTTRASDFQISQPDIHEHSQSSDLPSLPPPPFPSYSPAYVMWTMDEDCIYFSPTRSINTLVQGTWPKLSWNVPFSMCFFWNPTHPSDLSREKNQSAYPNIYNINPHTYHWLSQRIPKQLENIQNKYKTEQMKEKKSYRGRHVFKYLGWSLISAEFLICLWAFLNLKGKRAISLFFTW